jgi:hypothetical protein
MDDDAFLAAERRWVDERRRKGRTLGNPFRLLRSAKTEFRIALREDIQPCVRRFAQIVR